MNAKKEQLRNERQATNSITKPESPSPQKPKEDAKPINTDMLEQLKMKFGK